MNAILSTYFTKDNGFSQHDSSGGCKPNKFELIRKWYQSIIDLNLYGVIFHNELSQDFIKKYTNKNITFVEWSHQNRLSYNDERYYAFINYVTHNINIDKVLYTDIFDVQIHKDPFEFMVDDGIYVGSEESKRENSYTWVNKKLISLNYPLLIKPQIIYNAGICGGFRNTFLRFLEEMIRFISKSDPKINCNMGILNYCLHNTVKDKIFTGFPFHNIFKSFKNNGAYISHK